MAIFYIGVFIAVHGLAIDFVEAIPVELADEALKSVVAEVFGENIFHLFLIPDVNLAGGHIESDNILVFRILSKRGVTLIICHSFCTKGLMFQFFLSDSIPCLLNYRISNRVEFKMFSPLSSSRSPRTLFCTSFYHLPQLHSLFAFYFFLPHFSELYLHSRNSTCSNPSRKYMPPTLPYFPKTKL